jgi:putative ABC transport system permease protein
MRLDIAPILAALSRHRITATLLVLQIGLTCAIVCNALFVVNDRLRWMDTPSGVEEDRLANIDISSPGKNVDIHARTDADLAVLRAVPGVEAAEALNSVPFGTRSWSTNVRYSADEKQPRASVAEYYGKDVGPLFGAQLLEGRWIRDDEYQWIDDVEHKKVEAAHVIVVTQAVARRLFPGKNALGQTLYLHGADFRIIGVIRELARASGMRDNIGEVILTPWRMLPTYGAGYVIRTAPGKAGAVLEAAAAALKKQDPRRVITEKITFREIRELFFASDRALASFWVGQRRRQIGVRRALGATRGDVLRYFQVENFLLASMGIGLGIVLAYAINLVLMVHYEIPRLPLGYLPASALALWLLGQLAVLAPALRAASVPPVEATRG